MIVDRRTPRYSPSAVYDDRHQTSYFDRPFEGSYERRGLSPYDRGFHGYDSESRWGGEEVVRRTNRDAAIANNAIPRVTRHAQLHPMRAMDGRYPPCFSVPRRLEEFLYMDSRELDQIMMAYDLGSGRRRYYSGSMTDRFEDDDVFHRSDHKRLRDLVALFEFLGAYRLVEHVLSQ